MEKEKMQTTLDTFRGNAARVNAYIRVTMRRWLSKHVPEKHGYLMYTTIDSLAEVVEEFGGNPDKIIEEARRVIADRMYKDVCYRK